MYYFDNQQHNTPHIYVHYQDDSAVVAIASGKMLEGSLPKTKQKLVDAGIELRQEDLMADWQLAVEGDSFFKIDPLK